MGDGATAYLVWRVDCTECGEVTDESDGDEAPTECSVCGAPVEVGVT